MAMKKEAVFKEFDKTARKIRTLSDEHIVVLAGYCPGSAFLYQRWEDRKPTLRLAGDYFNGKIGENAKIYVAEISEFDSMVMITNKNAGNGTRPRGIIFDSNGKGVSPGGCVLMYGKPGKRKFHLHIIAYNGPRYNWADSFKVQGFDELYIPRAALGGFLVNNGFRFNWNGFYEEIFDRKIHDGGYVYG